MEDLNLIVELEKAIKKAKAGGELPPGGEWKTIRGARVYIVDGKIHAGAGGKLDGMTVAEAQELHDARTNKKSYDGIIHEGTEVKVGRERKTGKAVKVTPDHVHIDYGDGKEARQVRRNEARRADAWKLRMEEKIERANTTTPPILKPENAAKHHAKPNVHGEGLSAKDKAEKQKLDREDLGGNVKDDDEWAEDLVMSEQKAGKFRAPLLRRDAAGNPIKERLYDGIGNPVIDRYTGKHKERFIVEHSDSATEDDVVRDHQGLLISEVVNPLAKNYGLEHMQREWRDENGLPTDLYADLVQTANVGFLHGLREFVAKQSKGDETKVDILTHALTRARQYTKRQAQNIFADVKLPGRMMEPLAVINSVSEAMTQKLGRAPSESELLNGIEGVDGIKGNPTFKSYQMKGTPEFDQATGKFSDGKKLTDPAEKLSAMMQAKRLQHMGRLDKVTNAADSDDKEVTAKDIVKDDKQDTLDAMTAKQEVEDRMKKLRQGVKKLLGGLLDEREAQLIALRFGIGNRKQDGLADLSDVAEKMGLSLPNAKKISAAAMRKLTQADPATLERLKKIYMTKSLSGLDKLLKALFVEDLQKSLESFGLSVEDLEPKILRTDVGTEAELKKSLGITEFIASIVEAEGVPGVYRAYIYEYALPVDIGAVISKSFSKKADPLKKAESVKKYVQAHKRKYEAMSKKQHKEFGGKYGGSESTPWSVKLLLDNPGSCWITWHGDHILINGTSGTLLYDSSNQGHRKKYHPNEDSPEFVHDTAKDHGHEAVAEEMTDLMGKWKGEDGKGGYVKEWRNQNRDAFAQTPKAKISKQFPAGKFMMVNPYTGKRVVVNVELTDAGTPKARTEITFAFDPDADQRVNIGNWAEIYRHLYGEAAPKSSYEYLMNDANKDGKHKLDVLTDAQYDELYKGTTEGKKKHLGHAKIEEVESKVAGRKAFEADLGDGKVARFDINEHGHFADPVMNRLIAPSFVINDENDLMKALQDAVGNEIWVTVSPNSQSQLSHHVKLRYDGLGAPLVVGGAFDGYRFQDASETDDPAEKERSLFKGGKPVRPGRKLTEKRDVAFEAGVNVRIRNPQDRRKWITAQIIRQTSDGWQVEIDPKKGISFDNGSNIAVLPENSLKHTKGRMNVATEAPIVDVAPGGLLSMTVPAEAMHEDYGVDLDDEGRARISLAQFLGLRDKVGGFSLTWKAKEVLDSYYAQQERENMADVEKLLETYHPKNMDGFKEDSFLRKTNVYNTQAEGISHLITRRKAVAGHGMGGGKTLIGVVGSMYLRDQAQRAGQKPKKTLIVAPAGIVSVWLSEINAHTNVGAVALTNNGDSDGMFGNIVKGKDLRSKAVAPDSYTPDHDEHFVVMSYDQFMRQASKLRAMAVDGHFGNIIIDEAHAFKTAGKGRHTTLKHFSDAIDNVWAMTGTPMDNEVADAFQLIDAVTGGHHDLGTADDFARDYFYRQGGKVIAMNESKMDELGKKMSRYIQFRDGYSDNITYLDQKTGQRKKVSFPTVAGDNRSYGQLSHVTPFEVHSTVRKDRSGKTLKGEDGKTLHRQVFVPQPDNDSQRRLYDRYKQLEAESLSEAERQNLDDLSESGVNSGSQNYLQGIQKLQQFLNAPLSEQAYWEPIKNGRGETIGKRHIFERDPKTGHKLYYKAKLDDNGKVIGYEKDAHGKPVLLPPVHHDNPKAEALRKTVMDYLAEHEAENRRRIEQNKGLAPGEVPMPTGDAFPPKVVITSNFTTFGTDVVEAVLRDIQRDHGWNYGKFTGDQDNDREHDKVAFGQDPKTAFMVISDAGKEGIGLGNAHMLIHFDQDFNPNLMAQKSARALRSNSWMYAQRDQRPNAVKIVSLNMPGTIEDSIIRAQQRKLDSMTAVTRSTRKAEGEASKKDFSQVYAGSQRKWMQKVKDKSLQLVVRI